MERTPVEVVDELEDWLRTRIGDVAEDDWLLLDELEGFSRAVRREWKLFNAVSVANLEVKRKLQRRCARNLRRARAAFQALVRAWISRKEP